MTLCYGSKTLYWTDRDWLSVQFMLVQLSQRSVCVHPPVHADEGTSPGRDQVDGVHHAHLSKKVRQFVLRHKLGEVANPQSRTAN